MKKEQKLIRLEGYRYPELDQYLAEGWEIDQISAAGSSHYASLDVYCYVLLQRFVEENKE